MKLLVAKRLRHVHYHGVKSSGEATKRSDLGRLSLAERGQLVADQGFSRAPYHFFKLGLNLPIDEPNSPILLP